MDMMIIITCEDSFDGILTGIYEAWTYKIKGRTVKVETRQERNLELFCEYINVPLDFEKAKKVARTIRSKISEEAYQMIYRAAMSDDPEKADIIYHFMIDGFQVGAQIVNHLTNESVVRVFEMDRNVGMETHHYLGFVRFSQVSQGVLFSKIAPRNNILTMIAPHFTDRLGGENWVIYDEKRALAAFHESGKGWILLKDHEFDLSFLQEPSAVEQQYRELWSLFFQTIAIESRKNPRLQRGNIPLRYRSNMVEFND